MDPADRHNRRSEPILALVFTVSVGGLAIAGASSRGDERICVSLADNDLKIQRLIQRSNEFGRAWQEKRWSFISEDLTDRDDVDRDTIQAWERQVQDVGLHADLIHRDTLRVQQCGPIAFVVEKELWRERIASEQRSHLVVTARSWVLKDGEWYQTDAPERYVGSTDARKVLGNENGTRFWLTNPTEDFQEVWTAPGESGTDISANHQPPLGADLLDSGEARLTRKPMNSGLKRILRETLYSYGNAIMQGSESDTRMLWAPRPEGRSHLLDETFHFVRAEAAGGKVESFRVGKIEIMEYTSHDPKNIALSQTFGGELSLITNIIAKVEIIFTISSSTAVEKKEVPTVSLWLLFAPSDPPKWWRTSESAMKEANEQPSAIWSDEKKKWEPIEGP